MNFEDPKLTAYALGEREALTIEEQREIEALLESSAEARAFVEETAEFARTLEAEFRRELPEARLTAAGRSAVIKEVEKTAERTGPNVAPMKRKVVWGLGLGLAAGLAVALTVRTPDERGTAGFAKVEEQKRGEKALAKSAAASQPASEGAAKVDAPVPVAVAAPVAPVAPVAVATPSASKEEVPSGSLALGDQAIAAETARFRDESELGSNGMDLHVRSGLTISKAPFAPRINPSVRGNIALREGSERLTTAFRSEVLSRVNSGPQVRTEADGDNAPFNKENYSSFQENPFLAVDQNPLSTFSVDVDTASYANVRRFLNAGQRPPKGAVRIEELLNYFHYNYPAPKGDAPFATQVEVAQCPWQPAHRLVKIGIKGRELPQGERKPSNLVFLIDVSGSMDEPKKLPLLKQSFRLLAGQLGENDRVSIVVYAGAAGVVLPPTRGDRKEEIIGALERLQAGGSTNGAGGIQLAYRTAVEQFIPNGVNRVILATDGDFNVGMTSDSELVSLIEEKAKSGVYLTILGFGEGNLQDSKMKQLSTKGNGNYAYIDSIEEGRKVLVEQAGGTLVTIAKDVKIQVEFNPRQVSTYRLVGYENRVMSKEDFNDDRKDAGEIGAGHTVTALYEVVPAVVDEDNAVPTPNVDPLKYQPVQRPAAVVGGEAAKELLTVKLRYKKPEGGASLLVEQAVVDTGASVAQSSRDFRFAAAVAQFGMLLRESPHAGSATWGSVKELATEGKGEDRGGYRAEFINLVDRAAGLGSPRTKE